MVQLGFKFLLLKLQKNAPLGCSQQPWSVKSKDIQKCCNVTASLLTQSSILFQSLFKSLLYLASTHNEKTKQNKNYFFFLIDNNDCVFRWPDKMSRKTKKSLVVNESVTEGSARSVTSGKDSLASSCWEAVDKERSCANVRGFLWNRWRQKDTSASCAFRK